MDGIIWTNSRFLVDCRSLVAGEYYLAKSMNVLSINHLWHIWNCSCSSLYMNFLLLLIWKFLLDVNIIIDIEQAWYTFMKCVGCDKFSLLKIHEFSFSLLVFLNLLSLAGIQQNQGFGQWRTVGAITIFAAAALSSFWLQGTFCDFLIFCFHFFWWTFVLDFS